MGTCNAPKERSAFYSDNYLSLFPGESTTITARYATADLQGKPPFLLLKGYNVPPMSTPFREPRSAGGTVDGLAARGGRARCEGVGRIC